MKCYNDKCDMYDGKLKRHCSGWHYWFNGTLAKCKDFKPPPKPDISIVSSIQSEDVLRVYDYIWDKNVEVSIDWFKGLFEEAGKIDVNGIDDLHIRIKLNRLLGYIDSIKSIIGDSMKGKWEKKEEISLDN